MSIRQSVNSKIPVPQWLSQVYTQDTSTSALIKMVCEPRCARGATASVNSCKGTGRSSQIFIRVQINWKPDDSSRPFELETGWGGDGKLALRVLYLGCAKLCGTFQHLLKTTRNIPRTSVIPLHVAYTVLHCTLYLLQ